MSELRLTKSPVVRTAMLIRRPAADVFEAFVNPDTTTKFWFTKSSGRVEQGKQLVWSWEMYGVSAKVNVREVESQKRILIDWGEPGQETTVEWLLKPCGPESTYVTITNFGFRGDGDSVVAQALDSTGGFTSLLAGAKAFLERKIELNLVADAHPKEVA
jgi:uncharacterized protein YndB with AHSA1/START domain